MICIGIDVAKDKHDCFILSSEGEVQADIFTIPFDAFFDRIYAVDSRSICPCQGTGSALPAASLTEPAAFAM